jgi:hypothetical protein
VFAPSNPVGDANCAAGRLPAISGLGSRRSLLRAAESAVRPPFKVSPPETRSEPASALQLASCEPPEDSSQIRRSRAHSVPAQSCSATGNQCAQQTGLQFGVIRDRQRDASAVGMTQANMAPVLTYDDVPDRRERPHCLPTRNPRKPRHELLFADSNLTNELAGRIRNPLAVRAHVFDRQNDRLARVGEGLLNGFPLAEAAGQRRHHRDVTTVGVGLEEHVVLRRGHVSSLSRTARRRQRPRVPLCWSRPPAPDAAARAPPRPVRRSPTDPLPPRPGASPPALSRPPRRATSQGQGLLEHPVRSKSLAVVASRLATEPNTRMFRTPKRSPQHEARRQARHVSSGRRFATGRSPGCCGTNPVEDAAFSGRFESASRCRGVATIELC